MKKELLFLGILSCFVACRHKGQKIDKKTFELQASLARFSEIPDAPIYVKVRDIVRSLLHPEDVQVFYDLGKADKVEVKDFYIEEMERRGWRLHAQYDGLEYFLEFVRPSGMICIVSIRDKQKMVVTLLKKGDRL